ncbi:hypothetical protein ACHAWF_004078, partial [Thalassiosira exigua]
TTTVTLPSGVRQNVTAGKVNQINNVDDPTRDDVLADMAVLPQAVNRSSVEELLKLLRAYKDWDDDPDTVDGMPTYEIFVASPELYSDAQTLKYRDVDPSHVDARKELRRKFSAILQPYLDDVITPMVHRRYPDACTSKGPSRYCTPCYSLIRRYKHGQRQSHATHYDGHAIATAVVSLSDYGIDYRGGLYVSTGFGQREFVGLSKGDAVMHQSSLLHGVKVYDLLDNPVRTERWSWILWYRDSATCENYGYEWFVDCAANGNALCQQMHATKVGNIPGISQEEAASKILRLNEMAAMGGADMASIKMARAYLGLLPSELQPDQAKAAEYFQRAIKSKDPDGHYGTAQLLLTAVTAEYTAQSRSMQMQAWKDPRVTLAVEHLETAAYLGHSFAKFNLGIVHTFGYDSSGRSNGVDYDLAGQWFEESGLPEGYAVASHQSQATGDAAREHEMMDRARTMGFGAPWRVEARQRTGSGGAGGVDLNLPWPPALDGRLPPRF